MSASDHMQRPGRLEYLALLAIASWLTAVWLALWVEWISTAWMSGAALPPLWPLALAMAGLAASVITGWALGQANIHQRWARGAVAGAGVVTVVLLVVWAIGGPAIAAVLLSQPRLAEHLAPALPAFMAALSAWWQGEHLGRRPLGSQALRSAFYTGIVALAPLIFVNSLLGALSSETVLAALLLFFGLGLSGLSLASLRHLRQQPGAGRLMALTLSRQWLFTSGAVIGLVLGTGLLVARLVAPAALERLAGFLTVVVDRLALGLGLMLDPLAVWVERLLASELPGLSMLLERFMTTLIIAFERLQGLFALLVELVSRGLPRALDGRRLQAFLDSPAFQTGARWAGLLVLVAATAVVFWLAARRLWGLQTADEDEQRESVLSGRLLRAQLKNLLNRRPGRRRSPARDYLALSGAPDDARLIIRRAYQAMLEWARSLRLPRAAGQTPRAYAQMLAGAVPEGHDAIDLLTQAYVVARYAAEAPSLENARRAEGAMARLKTLHS